MTTVAPKPDNMKISGGGGYRTRLTDPLHRPFYKKMAPILSIKDLHYTYGSGKESVNALRGIDLEIDKGEIFGFLGPNGAGKTTTIKIILGILAPRRGRVELGGKSPLEAASRKRVGYMPETADYYRFLTPAELLYMYGDICGVERSVLRERIPELFRLVDLEGLSGRLMRTFSKGMMQKVSFAQALVNDPEFLVLDEPTSGLDPVSRTHMRDTLNHLRERGKTVFFSSHELSEVETISDRIGILNRGEIAACGPVHELLGEKSEGQSLENYFLKMIGKH